jgi:PhnB protein
MTAKPIPDGYDALIPYLVVRGASKAIDFYKQLFGATELHRMPYPNNPEMLAHAEIKIRDHVLMLGDENAQMNCLSPQSLNGPSPVSVMIYVPDVDATFKKASAMGVNVMMPPTDMFWGDRFAKFIDPFGHLWAVATHKKDVTPEELAKGAAAAFAEKGDCAPKQK